MSNQLRAKRPIIAPESEMKALDVLDRALQTGKPGAARLVGPDGRTMILPSSLYEVLRVTAGQLASGNGVSILPVMALLTTQEAANYLQVSRPHLVKLLEQRALPFHRVGTHRRIYLKDLVEYKEKRDRDAHRALNELVDEAQELGFYTE